MGFYLSLAVKNLLRHKKRTLITAVSIAMGIWAYIFMDSMVQGMAYDNVRNLVDYETSTLRIMHNEYWEEKDYFPLDIVVEDPVPVLTDLEKSGIPAVPRIRFSAELLYFEDPFPGSGSKRVAVYGIDPLEDEKVFRLRDALVDGTWFDEDPYSTILGAGIAEKIGAKLGYPILLRTRTRYGAFQTIDLVVSGIIDTPNPYIDLFNIYIPIETANVNLEMDGAVTEIDTWFPAQFDQKAAKLGVQEVLNHDLVAMTWGELEPISEDIIDIAYAETQVFTFFIFIIAMVGISNTLLNAVYERFGEIGMMRAMGMNDKSIVYSLSLEGAGIGLVGAVLGILIGLPSVYFLVEYGLDYTAIMGDMTFGFRTDPIYRGVWNPGTMVAAGFFGFLISGIIAIFPSRRAVKLSIVECLRRGS